MAPKLYLLLILLLLLSPTVYALDPIKPIAQTEQIIIYQHEQTRTWCQDQWDSKEADIKQALEDEKDDLETRFKSNLWLDRILSFISIFLACFMAFSLRSYLDHKRNRKQEDIDKLEGASSIQDLPELSSAPKAPSDYKVKQTEFDKQQDNYLETKKDEDWDRFHKADKEAKNG